MIPWTKLDVALSPDGAELTLWRRGDELCVRASGVDLMSNKRHGSGGRRSPRWGCAGLGAGASVLVGGLGLGFTLRAALGLLPAGARVLVSELFPAVVAWVRGPVGGAALLDDPRVTVDARDCAEILRESEARFDAILLDVDNGPSALTAPANAWLYAPEGLAAAARALRPGGRLAVWSAGDDPSFAGRLTRAGFAASTERARAHGGGGRRPGARHVIFVGGAGHLTVTAHVRNSTSSGRFAGGSLTALGPMDVDPMLIYPPSSARPTLRSAPGALPCPSVDPPASSPG